MNRSSAMTVCVPVRFPVLMVEGLPTLDNRVLTPGGVTADLVPIPVMRMSPHDGPVTVGQITELRRVPGTVTQRRDGTPFPVGTWVWSAEGIIDAPRDLVEEWSRTEFPAADMIIGDELVNYLVDAGNQLVFPGARLRGVTLVLHPAWPDARWELDPTVL